MTTIAVRGRAMAADSQGTNGGLRTKHKKIIRVGDALIGGSGDWGDITAFTRWYRDGADMTKQPKFHQYRGDADAPDFHIMVLDSTGLFLWTEYFQPFEIEADYWAVGSGAMAALAAMVMGADASQAVRVAIEVDVNSGGDVQVESLA